MGKNKKKSKKATPSSSNNNSQTQTTCQNKDTKKKDVKDKVANNNDSVKMEQVSLSSTSTDFKITSTKDSLSSKCSTNKVSHTNKKIKSANSDDKKLIKHKSEKSRKDSTGSVEVCKDWEDADIDNLDVKMKINQPKRNYSVFDINKKSKSKNESNSLNYQEFLKRFKNKILTNLKDLKEEHGDLFHYPTEYALAHCVAEDFHMNAGIAITFRRQFGGTGKLLDQNVRTGECAYLKVKDRYVYYLVSKRRSSGKPTSQSLFNSLCHMKSLIEEHDVKKIAMPTIGCGLDNLDWSEVETMIRYIFTGVETDIVICHFQKTETSKEVKPMRKANIVQSEYTLTNIEPETIILYFGTEDGSISSTIRQLDKKFGVLQNYRHLNKLGEPVRTTKGLYEIYGCIVRKLEKDRFSFEQFELCLQKIRKVKCNYFYIAFERAESTLFNDDLITLIKFIFHDLDIYTCAPIDVTD